MLQLERRQILFSFFVKLHLRKQKRAGLWVKRGGESVNYHVNFSESFFIPCVSQNGCFPFLEEESVALTSGAVVNHPSVW